MTEQSKIDLLADALLDVLEYLDDCSDTVDGPYGEPQPNRALRLATEVREAIYRVTGALA